MYQLDRRITHPVPDARRCCSTWPCQSQNATGEPGSAPTADSFTTRRTPAATAASMALVSQPTRRGSSAQDRNSVSGAVQRGAHGPRLRQVADGQLDAPAERAPGRAGIAHEGAHPLAPRGQCPRHLGPRLPGRSRDYDHVCAAPFRRPVPPTINYG